MSIVYFISVNNLKERTTIDLNVEDKLIESSIWDAQNIDIQNIIGTRLYLKLQSDVISNAITGLTTYKTLLDDYIEPCLIKYAQRRALLFIYAKIRNKGVSTQDSDNSIPVDITILNKVREEIQQDAEFYSNKLKSYLHEYSTSFPEYDDPNPSSLDHYNDPSIEDSYFPGIYLGNDNYCSRDWKNEK